MASTYTPADALTLCRRYTRDVPVDSIAVELCDMVHGRMWRYAPWKWTRDTLTAIALVDGTQDYASGDSDFYRLLEARIVRTSDTPDTYLDDLAIREALPPCLTPYAALAIEAVAWQQEIAKFRLSAAVSIGSGETLQLQGVFQKNPVKIDDSQLTTAFPFPDQYYDVFVEGLKYELYRIVGDSRAGGIARDRRGNATYTGQLGVFMDGLAGMASAEDFAGSAPMVPDTPLGVSAY